MVDGTDEEVTKRWNRGGWLPDLPDHRDKLFSEVTRALAFAPLPPSIDLRAECPPIVDQGNCSSCTANAIAGAVGFLEIKDKVAFVPVSRLFIYYRERAIEGTVKSDSGAMIRDGIKSLVEKGVCAESEWPYDIARFAETPPTVCYRDAAQHKVTAYARLKTLSDMRQCLASGFPFVLGFSVYESFESPAVARTGVAPMPAAGEQLLGGHAVMACGYDDAAGRLLCRNSWGTGWGMDGYFTLPYGFIMNRDLSDDFWTIRKENKF